MNSIEKIEKKDQELFNTIADDYAKKDIIESTRIARKAITLRAVEKILNQKNIPEFLETLKKMKSEMEKKGLVEIENPIGKSLDTDFHEAITSIPAKSKKDSGKIIDIIEKGYKMGNKVIRFTKVVIGK